ncbi:MAG: arylsulfatase [Verrucomicrobiota bacterium JB023]|nr:arylsulfatase [Verrucomicrobiota bacterium JB023]
MHKLLLSLAFSLQTAVSAERPNVLILYADDMGYGDLGANHSDSKIPTPHLDQLVAEGMNFTDGHSSSAICTPSRYALLTGRFHWRDFHGIVKTLEGTVFGEGQLTMAGLFQENGYDTACIGKWHLGWDWDAIRKPGTPAKSIQPDDFDWSKEVPDGPLDQGFDHYFGDSVINFPPYAWIEDRKLLRAPDIVLKKTKDDEQPKEGNWEFRPGPGLSDWDSYEVLPTLTEKSVEYVLGRRDQENPFFLYVPFPSPHAPIIPNDEFDGKSEAGPYGDFVYQTDDACGRIMQAVKDIGEWDNTIIIFTADNGPEHYAYQRDEKYDHWSAEPFRGLKRGIYEGGHHVPFIVRWPGLTEPGSECHEMISQVDLLATFASLLGASLPEDAAADSHDFLPYLKGEQPEGPRNVLIHNTYKGRYAVREGDWLLINDKTGYGSRVRKAWEKKRDYPADDDQPVELYNLKTDLAQKENVAAEHQEKVAAMQELLETIREQGHSAPRLSEN